MNNNDNSLSRLISMSSSSLSGNDEKFGTAEKARMVIRGGGGRERKGRLTGEVQRRWEQGLLFFLFFYF